MTKDITVGDVFNSLTEEQEVVLKYLMTMSRKAGYQQCLDDMTAELNAGTAGNQAMKDFEAMSKAKKGGK